MLWLAWPAVVTAWLVQFCDTGQWLVVPAGLWAAAVLLAWCICGERTALLLMVAAWTLCRAGWQLEARYPDALARQDVLISGYVCDFAARDAESTRFAFEADGEKSHGSAAGRIHLNWYEQAPDLRPGQRWQLLVRLKPPRGLSNPGAFDFEQWLYSRGIGAMGYVRQSALNRMLPARAGGCPVGSLRNGLASRIEAALGDHRGAGYVLGVTVGATHRLQQSDWDLMQRTGTTHLLAISGLNIAMVAAPFVLAGPFMGRMIPSLAGRPLAGLLAGLGAAAIYTALSGFAVSTVRALFMLGLATAVAACRRHVSGLDLLRLAALLIVLLDPPALVSVSFWLSFLAVAWLFVLYGRQWGGADQPGPRSWRSRLTDSGTSLCVAQLVLGIGLAPLSLGWFQQVSLVAPLANLLAVPVFTLVVMPLALLGGLLVWLVPPLGESLLQLAAGTVGHLVTVLEFLGAREFAIWKPPAVGWRELTLCAASASLLCWWRPLPWRAGALVLLLPVIFGVRHDRPLLSVMVLDVGQGLAVLVETRRHRLLYDTGPRFRRRDAGESVVLPALRHLGSGRLDLLVVSHSDDDHRGGAASVLEAFPGLPWTAPERFEAAGNFTPCQAGHSWVWDGVRFRFLSPARAGAWRSDNDSSCVLLVEAPRATVLLPGDIDRQRERALVENGLRGSLDLVLASHHGSRSSSDPDFVRATAPRYVVFSSGHLNRWRFPAGEVVSRWEAGGACLLDTAASGALVFTTEGDGWLRLRRRQRAEGAHLWTADVLRSAACPETTAHAGGVMLE